MRSPVPRLKLRPRTAWRRVALPPSTAVFVLPVFVFSGCASAGPAALGNGRSAYNAIINETEDQQILSMIVHLRYDETFGLLAVSSVTASLSVGVSAGGNVGIGPDSAYAGNLVPLSVGATYEENPTISYVPMRGEQFVQRMLAPVSAEQALLLGRMSTDQVEVLRLLVRRANGLVNPLYASQPAASEGEGFDRFIDLYSRLRDQGKLDVVRATNDEFQMLIHNYAENDSPAVQELLRLAGIQRTREDRGPISVPLRFFVGASRTDGLDLETPSALEVIEAAASSMDVPGDHVSDGRARASPGTTRREFIAIHSSSGRPANASVAVKHHGWWFFVDGRDARSKQAFMVLRTLIGLRLDDTVPGQRVPVLTVPVAR